MKNLVIAAFIGIFASAGAGASRVGPAGSSASPFSDVTENVAPADGDCEFALSQCQEYCQTSGGDPRPCLKACAKEYLECLGH